MPCFQVCRHRKHWRLSWWPTPLTTNTKLQGHLRCCSTSWYPISHFEWCYTGLILGLCPANERWHYFVTASLSLAGCKHRIISYVEIHSTLLTHWGQVTHICVSKLIIIGSDNGLSPDRHRAIIWTNAWSLSIEPLRTYFNENVIKIQQFSLKKMHVKMSSAKWRPFCLGLNVLIVKGNPV